MKSTRLKRVATLAAGGTPQVDDPSLWDDLDGIPWVSIGDITRSPRVSDTDRRVSALGRRSKNLPVGSAGTVLFAMYASVGAIGTLATGATWNQAILGIAPHPTVADSRFIAYWLQHLGPTLSSLFRSNTQDNLNAEQVGNLPFPIVSVDEQRSIADFLDTETARLDAIVSRSARADSLASEHLDAATDQALLSGGPNFQPLRRVVGGLTVGVVVNPSTYVTADGTVPFYRGVDVRPFMLNTADAQRISASANRLLRKSTLRTGDLVMVRVGEPGATAVVPAEADGSNCASLLVIRSSPEMDSTYLCHALNSQYGRGQTRALSTGAAQLQINASAIARFLVPVRRLSVQRDIGAQLEAQRVTLQQLLGANRRQRLLIQERRQALITAAVTGQFDVTTARGIDNH